MMRTAAVLLLAASLVPAAAAQPWIVGPDIQVGASFFAACPAVAMSANGEFEVAWNDYYSESHPVPQGIFVRHFDRQGRPTHAREIRLDSPKNVEASDVRILALPGGRYFVAWFEARSSRATIAGRFLDPAGRPQGPVLRLARRAGLIGLAVVDDDSLLVAWKEGSQGILRARRYDFTGQPQGEEMRLAKLGELGVVSLASLGDSIVAAWERWNGRSWETETQRFSLRGEPLAPAARLNNSLLGGQFRVEIATDGKDRFGVAWTRKEQLSDLQTDDETRARFFDRTGASSPEAHPNELPAGNQEVTGLAMDGRGLALVTWQSDRNSATSFDAAGRFLDASGRFVSKAFPLSRNRAGNDLCPAAATSGGEEWVVAWLKQGTGIYARRLVSVAPSSPAD